MSQVIHIITGPTAVGKTALALDWAEQHQAEILSCDAFLVYQGMDIGTAKPSVEERARVPHHGIDLVPANSVYNVAAYVEQAEAVVKDIFSRGKNVLITGGSGFYLKSFFAPVIDLVEVPESIVAEVKSIEAKEGLAGMSARLMALNPDGVGKLDILNPRRVVKALERCMATGKTVTLLREEFEARGTVFDAYERKMCVLHREQPSLNERIADRTRIMIEAGLVEEVKSLLTAGLKDNPSAAAAIGYAQTIEWLAGKGTKNELQQLITNATTKLVRKQRSWLRNQLPAGKEIKLTADSQIDLASLFE